MFLLYREVIMKVLLALATLLFGTGCSTTPDGRDSFLGITAFDHKRCADEFTLKQKKLVYNKCF